MTEPEFVIVLGDGTPSYGLGNLWESSASLTAEVFLDRAIEMLRQAVNERQLRRRTRLMAEASKYISAYGELSMKDDGFVSVREYINRLAEQGS